MTRLRILVVSPALPVPSWGFGTRVLQLVAQMSPRHEVTVLTYAWADEMPDAVWLQREWPDVHVVVREVPRTIARRRAQLRSMLSEEPFHLGEMRSAEMQDAIDTLCEARRFDVVQLESTAVCAFRYPSDAVLVLDEHNIEYELRERMGTYERSLARRLFNDLEHRKARHHEQRYWDEVDAIAVTSDREEAVVRAHATSALTAVVPNGVDVEHFAPWAERPSPDALVFTGLLGYRPNLDAALHLVDDILPRIQERVPGVRLTIVGRGRPADLERLRRPNVEVTGFVPDVRPYLARAAVVVVPLRMGGGTRLKVIEALSMGKAVVSTTVGCEGLETKDERHVVVADADEHFAAEVHRLLTHPMLCNRLGAAGRRLAVERYSWARSADALDRLVDAAVRRRRSSVDASTSYPSRQDW